MKITVVGAGYVGLVSAACLAEFGFDVACIDKDESKLKALNNGGLPIFEPGLDRLVRDNCDAGRLTFSGDLAGAVPTSDVVFIAVGTPSRRGEDAADLSFVRAAAEEIVNLIDGFTVVVTKSTVPVGTAGQLRELMHKARPEADFEVASNPEFLREGSACEDFLRPDRIVLGIDHERAKNPLRQIYRPVSATGVPLVFTSCEAAELIKYAANTYLATRIGFVNQLADLCEVIGADIKDVARGMGLDARIGQHYLQPGPGFGGSCFPKDTRAMIHIARDFGKPFTIVERVVAANGARMDGLADRVKAALGGSVGAKKIGVLGIAFKAETDDIREAASLAVIPALQADGAVISAYDPAAMAAGKRVFANVDWCDDAYSAAKDADGLVVLTEWNEFRGLDLDRLAGAMARPVMIDMRSIFSPHDIAQSQFEYHSIGRAVIRPERAAPSVRIASS